MTDQIEISALRVVAIVGALPHEREIAQPLQIDLDTRRRPRRCRAVRRTGRHRALRQGRRPGRWLSSRSPRTSCSNASATRVADEVLTFERVEAATVVNHQAAATDRGRRRIDVGKAVPHHGRRGHWHRVRHTARSSRSARTSATGATSCAPVSWPRPRRGHVAGVRDRTRGRARRSGRLPEHGRRTRDHTRPVRVASPLPADRGRGDAPARWSTGVPARSTSTSSCTTT